MTQPNAIVCLTGSELTRGETRDLNGPYLAAALTTMGFRVEELRFLPDDPGRLESGLREAARDADLVVVSGGLGPTADDCTVRALAGAFGRGVHRDPRAERRMRERVLARFGSEARIPANFYKQAEVVRGSRVLLNPAGLAPGCIVESGRGFVVVLPGVPAELRAMFEKRVVPAITERFPSARVRFLRAKVLGVPESWAEDRVQKLGIDTRRIDYGISARPGELTLKFLARDPADHGYLDEVRGLVEKEFAGDVVFLPDGLPSTEDAELEYSRVVHEMLVRSGRTLATAESCTGGLVAATLTGHPGSSSYFLGSVVAYHDAVKGRFLDVDPKLLDAHGAVSPEVCAAMASGVRRRFDADYGLSITGIAGPGGATPQKPVGLVYIGLARPAAPAAPAESVEPLVLEHRFPGTREMVRRQATVRSLDMLRRDLEKSGGYHSEG